MSNHEPRMYVACPLSSRDEVEEQGLREDCRVIAEAIVNVARDDSPQWSCGVHAPIDHTSPRLNNDPPREIWRTNRREVQARSDALIAHGDQGGSNGVGQEITWAFDCAMPLLYAQPTGHVVSKQLVGMAELSPSFEIIEFGDRSELREAVTGWTRRHRSVIQDGPRYRALLTEAWKPLWDAAIKVWISISPTEREIVTAASRMDPDEIDDLLDDPLFLARVPTHKLHALVGALALDPALLPIPAIPRMDETEMVAFEQWRHEGDVPHREAVLLLLQARTMRGARQRALAARERGFNFQTVEGWTKFLRWGGR